VVRAQTRQVHNLQVGQAVAVVIRVADPQALVVRKVLLRALFDVGIEDTCCVFCAIRAVRERRNRAVRLCRHLLALFGGHFHPLVRRRVVLVNRRGLHHRPETVVAQRVHLAAAGAEVFQFLLSRKLNLFLFGFLVTHMFPFFSVRSFRARFFLSKGTKKAPRAVRGSLSASFDDMILTHFCRVRIRVFRQDSVDVLLSCETHYYLTFIYVDLLYEALMIFLSLPTDSPHPSRQGSGQRTARR